MTPTLSQLLQQARGRSVSPANQARRAKSRKGRCILPAAEQGKQQPRQPLKPPCMQRQSEGRVKSRLLT